MRPRAADAHQAAESTIAEILAELAEMDDAAAEDHAINVGAVALLRELEPEARHDYGHNLVARVPALAAEVNRACQPSGANQVAPQWTPFPAGALGYTVGRYCTQVAEAIGCDVSMVALPALACLAGVIGNRRVVQLKPGWTEPPIVWPVVVARSGARKSPALSEVARPLRRAEAEALELETQRRADYQAELQRWQDAPRGARGDRPVEPEPGPRLVVSDITVEALALRLSHSPGGLLVIRDELAGWIRGFDAYRGGHGGDAQNWLQVHRGEPITVDRRSGDTLSVRRAAVSIVGTVQPEVLAASLKGEHMSDGLAARLLYAMPPTTPARFTDAEVTNEMRDAWALLLGDLCSLRVPDDPVVLPLTPEARTMYRRWYDRLNETIAAAESDAQAASGSKIEGYAARLALIVALAADAQATEVDVAAMASGIELADWFGAEAQRVYASMTERPEDRERRRLIELIAAKGGAVTARELSHGPQRYRKPGAATVALDDLVDVGAAMWREDPPADRPQGGGHRVRRCVLHGGDTGDGDTSLPFSPVETGDTSLSQASDSAGSTTVATGDTSRQGETQVSPSPETKEESSSAPGTPDPDRFTGMDWQQQRAARVREIRERGDGEGQL